VYDEWKDAQVSPGEKLEQKAHNQMVCPQGIVTHFYLFVFVFFFIFLLLFICAYKAWFISPPCPHPLPYHPLHPLPHPPTPSIPSRNYFALISNFVVERV
jgi:hypothetical protein